MISIVIPLYNKENRIKYTLQSVFNQTFQDFEIVVVNDGSTDNSVAVLTSLKDERIRLIYQENQGVSAARNKGIEEAKYDYVALLDADDEWKSDYLTTQINLIQTYPECSVFATAYELRDSKGNSKPVILNKVPFMGENGILTNYFEVASCSQPPICSINIIAKKEAFLTVGGFPVGVKSGEDLLTWAKLAINYEIAYNLRSKAVFVQEERYKGKLEDRIDKKDTVGTALKRMYDNLPTGKMKEDFKCYLIRWNKIQSSLLIEVGDTAESRHSVQKAFDLGASKKDIMVQYILSRFPGILAKHLWNVLNKMR